MTTQKNSYTKKEIRQLYQWSKDTFISRTAEIPGFNEIVGRKRILSINEAELIFSFYGRPKVG
jgi:hypothetical protein